MSRDYISLNWMEQAPHPRDSPDLAPSGCFLSGHAKARRIRTQLTFNKNSDTPHFPQKTMTHLIIPTENRVNRRNRMTLIIEGIWKNGDGNSRSGTIRRSTTCTLGDSSQIPIQSPRRIWICLSQMDDVIEDSFTHCKGQTAADSFFKRFAIKSMWHSSTQNSSPTRLRLIFYSSSNFVSDVRIVVEARRCEPKVEIRSAETRGTNGPGQGNGVIVEGRGSSSTIQESMEEEGQRRESRNWPAWKNIHSEIFDRYSEDERDNKRKNILKKKENQETKHEGRIEIDKWDINMIWRVCEDLCRVAKKRRSVG
jgi:hypothetical protein